MTFYTDESCGIIAPHVHTGEVIQSHYVEYWCMLESKWVSESVCDGEDHHRARTQSTVTEIIDILPVPEPSNEQCEASKRVGWGMRVQCSFKKDHTSPHSWVTDL